MQVMGSLLTFLLFIALSVFVRGQTDLESAIEDVFGGPPGNSADSCSCVPIHRCRTNVARNTTNDLRNCAVSEICCDRNSILPESASERGSPSSSTSGTTFEECVCVLADECSGYYGEGIIGERKSCNPFEVCCDRANIVKPGPVTPKKPEPEITDSDKCICVPAIQCARTNYGEGIINERKSCSPFEVCCDRDAITTSMPIIAPVTLSSKPVTRRPESSSVRPPTKCTCVPVEQCRRDQPNFGEGLIDERISCNPFEVCCDDNSIVPPTRTEPKNPTNPTPIKTKKPTTPEPPVTSRKCGVRRIPNGLVVRITDDESSAAFGEFPWMTAILEDQVIDGNPNKLATFRCGGSLIHPQIVLTGAHCVDKAKQYRIRVGEWDVQNMNESHPHEDMEVKQIILHPKFYKAALFNDVALLYLKDPVALRPNVDLVCLPSVHQVVHDTRCIVTGWGKDRWDKKGKYAHILRKIDLPIIQRDRCQDLLRKTRLGKYFELHESFICAGGEEGKDACKGDGGSPLVCPIPGHTNEFFQVGIVAWGIDCGYKDIPGVYANVAEFREWIEEETNKLGVNINEYQYYD